MGPGTPRGRATFVTCAKAISATEVPSIITIPATATMTEGRLIGIIVSPQVDTIFTYALRFPL
jgi:hypothetical protein